MARTDRATLGWAWRAGLEDNRLRSSGVQVWPRLSRRFSPRTRYKISGSVEISSRARKIRDSRCFKFVVCYPRRRRDGRSRTPAFCSCRPASLEEGAPASPKPFQQASGQPAAVASHPISEVLQGFDLARSRSLSGRAPRTARGAGAGERTRFHDSLSLSESCQLRNHRPRRHRGGVPVAQHAQKQKVASRRGGRAATALA